jgi:hypothetical protein
MKKMRRRNKMVGTNKNLFSRGIKAKSTGKRKISFSSKVKMWARLARKNSPKNYARVRNMDFAKMKPGDIILSTPVTKTHLISWGIRALFDSPYSHAIVYLGVQNGQHFIKEYQRRGAVLTTLERKLTLEPSNMLVLRWKGHTDPSIRQKQIEGFLKNVMRDTGRYDFELAMRYGLHELSNGRIKIKEDKKRWTCSELVADAAQPTIEEIQSGRKSAVIPPLIPTNIDREEVHPGILFRAFEEGRHPLSTMTNGKLPANTPIGMGLWFEPVAVTEEKWVPKKNYFGDGNFVEKERPLSQRQVRQRMSARYGKLVDNTPEAKFVVQRVLK